MAAVAISRTPTTLQVFGRRVAELRDARGWTQEVAATRLGCSAKYYQSIESGKRNLSILSLQRLADALGTDVAALFHKPSSTSRPRAGRPKRHPA
jgi:transcriptional regulator with XRE-family HTH domain